jgi:hypothetical protein
LCGGFGPWETLNEGDIFPPGERPIPMQYIAARDAKGRIVRPGGDYLEILAAGRMFNWASPYRRMCAKCRRSAMRGSALCCWHDPEFRRTRTQRAIDSGDPQRIAKVPERKHRSMMATLWGKDPWFNGRTIWLAPTLEEIGRDGAEGQSGQQPLT